MSTMWRRMGSYLGLVEEYDDIDLRDDAYADEAYPDEPRAGDARSHDAGVERAGDSNVRRISPTRGDAPRGPAVRAVPNAAVHLTAPTTFNDVEEVGARFRSGVPVIMDLAAASETVAKRVLDFASGLIYGLEGRIERVGDRVFLLTPMGVEVSTEERRKLSERGFFNQA
jgi:cell division inhibitor SepF